MNVETYKSELATIVNDLPFTKQVQIKPYSNFLNFTLDELLFLVKGNIPGDISYRSDMYAGKLLRFSEFNLWSYRNKLKEKKLGNFETKLFHNLLISFFLNEYLVSLDYRYFNVALKLSEVTFSDLFNGASNKKTLRLIHINNNRLIESILGDE